MKQTRFSKLFYVLLLFVLVACQAQATSAPVTAPLPATAVPPTATPAKPPAAPVLAEWKIDAPSSVESAFGSIWITGHHDSTVTRIDPVLNKVIAVIKGTGDHAEQTLAVGDAIWVTGQRDDTTWIDPLTNLFRVTKIALQ